MPILYPLLCFRRLYIFFAVEHVFVNKIQNTRCL